MKRVQRVAKAMGVMDAGGKSKVQQGVTYQAVKAVYREFRIYGKIGVFFILFGHFLDFALYGSWEGLVVCKILPRGAPTISTPGKPHSENFFFRILLPPPASVF